MKYIKELREGDRIAGVYLCKQKQSAVTKNGKAYENVILQDKTGTVDAKIWDPNSQGIDDFDALDYIDLMGDVTSFAGSLQVSIKRSRKADEGSFDPGDYLPVSVRDRDSMYQEVLALVQSVKNPWLSALLKYYFEQDEAFVRAFKFSSAAKSVHHGFVGGLLEHTLSVAGLCEYYVKMYPYLNRDLLVTSALCHDIGKTKRTVGVPC